MKRSKTSKTPITRLDGLPTIEIKCPRCSNAFKAAMFSRAFSSNLELVCCSCGVQAGLMPYGNTFKHVRDSNSIEDYLMPCHCGGRFAVVSRRYDLYRCPECKELLDEDLVLASLGVDREAWQSRAPFCGSVNVDGEDIEYTNPGLETIGHIADELWDHNNDDIQFQQALAEDAKLMRQFDEKEEQKTEQ
jgi:hypothetical protein